MRGNQNNVSARARALLMPFQSRGWRYFWGVRKGLTPRRPPFGCGSTPLLLCPLTTAKQGAPLSLVVPRAMPGTSSGADSTGSTMPHEFGSSAYDVDASLLLRHCRVKLLCGASKLRPCLLMMTPAYSFDDLGSMRTLYRVVLRLRAPATQQA